MALSLNQQEPSDDYIATARLWLTEDRSRVVPEGDPAARFLYAIPGRAVPRAEALKYGLIPVAEPEVKERVPEETKQIVPDETKAVKQKVAKKVVKKPTRKKW